MSPRRRFVLLVGAAVLVGAGLRIATGLTDDSPSTDETAYLASGTSLVDGDGFTRGDRPELHFPPLVPFVLGVLSRVFDDPHTGTVVATVVCGTAAIAPLSLLGRRVAGDAGGIATAWVAALAPGLATTPAARGAGSEAEYVLLLVTAVLLVVVAHDRTGAARAACAAAAGLLVGLAYLTRPEGLFMAVPLGAALVLPALAARPVLAVPGTAGPGLAVVRPGGDEAAGDGDAADGEANPTVPAPTWPTGWTDDAGQLDLGALRLRLPAASGLRALRGLRVRAGVVVGAAFAVPLLVCVVPYAMFLHDHTGKWELTAKTQDNSIEAWHAVARDDRRARDEVLYALDDEGTGFANSSRTALAALAENDPSGYAGILATNVASLGKNVAGWWLLPLPVWAAAAVGAWRMRRSRTVRLLLATGALPVATALAFFVQPRYLVVTVAMATVLAGAAVATAPVRVRRGLAAGGAALLAAASGLAFYGAGGWWHPNDSTDQRRAGEWISTHTDPGDRVMTRSLVVDHYADRTTVALPYADLDDIVAFARHHGARYLVVDSYTVARLRPQLRPLATDPNTLSTDRSTRTSAPSTDRPPRHGANEATGTDTDEAPGTDDRTMAGDPSPDDLGLELVHEVTAEGRTTRVFALVPPPPAPPAGEPVPSLGFMGDGSA